MSPSSPCFKWILFIPDLGKRGRPIGKGVKQGGGGLPQGQAGTKSGWLVGWFSLKYFSSVYNSVRHIVGLTTSLLTEQSTYRERKARSPSNSMLPKDLCGSLHSATAVFCPNHTEEGRTVHTTNFSTQCLSCAVSNLWLEPRLFWEALWGVTRSRTSWIHHNTERLEGGSRKESVLWLSGCFPLAPEKCVPSGNSTPAWASHEAEAPRAI